MSVGADERSRTSDLRITNALLYQLSYIGETEILAENTAHCSGCRANVTGSAWQLHPGESVMALIRPVSQPRCFWPNPKRTSLPCWMARVIDHLTQEPS